MIAAGRVRNSTATPAASPGQDSPAVLPRSEQTPLPAGDNHRGSRRGRHHLGVIPALARRQPDPPWERQCRLRPTSGRWSGHLLHERDYRRVVAEHEASGLTHSLTDPGGHIWEIAQELPWRSELVALTAPEAACVTWRTYAADLPVRGRAQRHNPDRSVHVPDHALMAVVFRWSIASVCPPEKRKVGGSTPPLTTIIATLALVTDLRKGRQWSSAAEISS
jgi:hypothetical protein